MTRLPVSVRTLGPFDDFSSDMERVFDSLLGRTFGTLLRNNTSEKFVPNLDLAETADVFEVRVDLPGIKPEDVKLELHDGQLTISGKRDVSTERKDKNLHYVERATGTFVRTLALPLDVDSDKIDARYEHGVLHVTLPKSAKIQPKKIEIRTA